MDTALALHIAILVVLFLSGTVCGVAARLAYKSRHHRDLILFVVLSIVCFAGFGFLFDAFTLLERR